MAGHARKYVVVKIYDIVRRANRLFCMSCISHIAHEHILIMSLWTQCMYVKNEFNIKKMNGQITYPNVRATLHCLQTVSKQSIPSLLNMINACVNCN